MYSDDVNLPLPGDSEIDLRERSPLALAFVGDGVLELMARARLVAESRANVHSLHQSAVELVSARAQSALLEKLEPMLSEQEAAVVRRGRNASKASVAKNASPTQYQASTGLEALLGWLYLQNNQPRLKELFEVMWESHKKGN